MPPKVAPPLPPVPSLPPRDAALEAWTPALQTQSPFFCLPPELRQAILRQAFGDRTIHMDLRFRPPLDASETSGGRGPVHGGFPPLARTPGGALFSYADYERDLDSYDTDIAWRWYSCVCHRNPPAARGSPEWRDPCQDYCLYGQGECSSFPGELPAKCMVGAMGFLLSCKRAYEEAAFVLYATNTIFIESNPLINGVLRQGLVEGAARLTGPGMQLVTSLHLKWHLQLFYGPSPTFRAGQRLLFFQGVDLLPRAFPNLRQLELIFPTAMNPNFHPVPEADLSEVDRVFLRPLKAAGEAMASLHEFNVVVSSALFYALLSTAPNRAREVRETFACQKRGLYCPLQVWYQFTDPWEERGRPGKGFFVRHVGGEFDASERLTTLIMSLLSGGADT